MARFFKVNAASTLVPLDEQRNGNAAFTVGNSTSATIRGEATVVPAEGASRDWFNVERPSRSFERGASDQVVVTITVPPEAPAGRYGFTLRMLLGGGVPEEQFDDSQLVEFDVEAIPPPPPPPPPPPKPKFPWWLVVLGAIVVLVVIGIIAWLLWPKDLPPLTGDDVRIVSAQPAPGTTLSSTAMTTFRFRIQYSLESRPAADLYVSIAQFANATGCSGTGGSLVEADRVRIANGQGETTVTVSWAGRGGQGYVAPAPSLWQTEVFARIEYFGVDQAYCYRYGP